MELRALYIPVSERLAPTVFAPVVRRATLLRQIEVQAGDSSLLVVLRGGLGRNTAVRRDHRRRCRGFEFGLNSRETLHTVQYLNDLPNTRILLTGMTSQWEAIGKVGSDGRAFQRRVSYETQLTPFHLEQTDEMIRRRIATATGVDHDEWRDVPLEPITEGALDEIHDRSSGVPAVATSALSELVGLAAYRYEQTATAAIDETLANRIDYPDPLIDAPDAATDGDQAAN